MSEFQNDPYTRHLHEAAPHPGQQVAVLGERAVRGLFEAVGRGMAVAGTVLDMAGDSVGKLLHH